MPKKLEGKLSKEKFDKSQAYGIDKKTFSIFKSIIDLIYSTSFLYFMFLPFAWYKSGELMETYSSY